MASGVSFSSSASKKSSAGPSVISRLSKTEKPQGKSSSGGGEFSDFFDSLSLDTITKGIVTYFSEQIQNLIEKGSENGVKYIKDEEKIEQYITYGPLLAILLSKKNKMESGALVIDEIVKDIREITTPLKNSYSILGIISGVDPKLYQSAVSLDMICDHLEKTRVIIWGAKPQQKQQQQSQQQSKENKTETTGTTSTSTTAANQTDDFKTKLQQIIAELKSKDIYKNADTEAKKKNTKWADLFSVNNKNEYNNLFGNLLSKFNNQTEINEKNRVKALKTEIDKKLNAK